MTVQELYDLTQKQGRDPRKVELFLFEGKEGEGDPIAEVVFDKHPEQYRGWRGAFLVQEGAIHL